MTTQTPEYDRLFKIVVLGDPKSGKASFVQSFAHKPFLTDKGKEPLMFAVEKMLFLPGFESVAAKVAFLLCWKSPDSGSLHALPKDVIKLIVAHFDCIYEQLTFEDQGLFPGSIRVKLQLWNVMKYRPNNGRKTLSLSSSACRNVCAAFICFAVNEPNSIGSIKQYLQDLDCYSPQDAVRIIVACKTDVGKCPEVIADVKKLVLELQEGTRKENAREKFFYVETSAKTGAGVHRAFRLAIEQVEEMLIWRQKVISEAKRREQERQNKNQCNIF
jgi:GTPase SAR1 family protein